jgi:hypothetical protein
MSLTARDSWRRIRYRRQFVIGSLHGKRQRVARAALARANMVDLSDDQAVLLSV